MSYVIQSPELDSEQLFFCISDTFQLHFSLYSQFNMGISGLIHKKMYLTKCFKYPRSSEVKQTQLMSEWECLDWICWTFKSKS